MGSEKIIVFGDSLKYLHDASIVVGDGPENCNGAS